MKRHTTVIVCFCVWVGAIFPIFSGEISKTEASPANYGDTLRAIKDVVERLRFDRILKETGQFWVLAKIIPDSMNGVGRLEGGYISPETGGWIKKPGEQTRIVGTVGGTCKVIGVLTGQLKREKIEYQWGLSPTNYPFSTSGYVWEDQSEFTASDSPLLVGGGYVICRINEKLEGAGRIRPVFLLPPGWEKFVVPAWEYYQANSEFFRKETASQKREDLSKLLRDENSLLAVLACRTLGEAGLLDNASLRQPLSESREFKQAALMFLLWKYTPENTRPIFVETISKIVESARTSEEIKGIALGALFTYEPFDGLQYELQIMKALEKKQLSLGVRSETDRYVNELVKDQLETLTEQAKEHEERKRERAAQSRSE